MPSLGDRLQAAVNASGRSQQGHQKKPSGSVPAPLARTGYITFSGTGFQSGKPRSFSAMCGDDPPTITDGYAIWTTVNRPLLRGVTVFTGYNPAAMTVSLRFGVWQNGSWQVDTTAGATVEGYIDSLGWMAGERFAEGPSPAVYVNSGNSSVSTKYADLIPPQYQNYAWVVNGVTWGQAWREPQVGQRIYQEATVSLLQYTGYAAPPPKKTSESGGYFVVKGGFDTPLKIAAAPLSQSPVGDHQTLARRIVAAPQNKKLKLRGVNTKIRGGSSVFIPEHQI